MNNQDDQLHRLLQQWQAIEPSINFDAQVWRRIRQSTPVGAPSFADWLRSLLPRPVFALTAATVAGVMIGVSSGMFSAPVTHAPGQLSFLAPGTLAGALRR
jgi:hypothetical protein